MEGEERMKLGIIIFSVLLFGCSEINKKLGLEDDNILEEAVEVLIYSQTALDFDLTPDTPEHDE